MIKDVILKVDTKWLITYLVDRNTLTISSKTSLSVSERSILCIACSQCCIAYSCIVEKENKGNDEHGLYLNEKKT